MSESRRIKYRRLPTYKYTLAVDAVFSVGARPEAPIITPFIELSADGILTVKAGYSWDGTSGPTMDTLSTMRGGLAHDAMFQLMRLEALEAIIWKHTADTLLYRLLREDGMNWLRANTFYLAVTWFGRSSTSSNQDAGYAPVLSAPT